MFSGQLVGLVCIGLLVGAYVVRRFLPRLKQRVQAAGRLQMLGLLALTPQCSVALVQAGRETLVLGVTPQTVTLLTKTEQGPSPEEAQIVPAAPRPNEPEAASLFLQEARTAL